MGSGELRDRSSGLGASHPAVGEYKMPCKGMDLHCPHCGERSVARGFGRCPGCYKELPEELQISEKERLLDEMASESDWPKSLNPHIPDGPTI